MRFFIEVSVGNISYHTVEHHWLTNFILVTGLTLIFLDTVLVLVLVLGHFGFGESEGLRTLHT